MKKKSSRVSTLRQGVENIWIFARFRNCWENPSKGLRAAEKSQGATEKNKEKVESNCTGFSAVLWFSVSRNVLFCQGNKNSNVHNFFPELDKTPPTSSEILRTLSDLLKLKDQISLTFTWCSFWFFLQIFWDYGKWSMVIPLE